MRVLVACEESQVVCSAFRERGHEAFSCDLKETSGDHPEWHIIGDCLEIINDGWDLIIAHPPSTYISTVATRLHSLKSTPLDKINERTYKRLAACEFFMNIATADCDKIAIENPVGVMNSVYRKPDQIIEPYEYAITEDEAVTKRTCLWLKNLPLLIPINNFERPDNKKLFGTWSNGKAKNWTETRNASYETRGEVRSKTFHGIAKAMAEQWG